MKLAKHSRIQCHSQLRIEGVINLNGELYFDPYYELESLSFCDEKDQKMLTS